MRLIKILLMTFSLFTIATIPANSQAGAITVGVFLNQLEDSVKSMGDGLEDNLNRVQQDAYVNMLNLIHQTRAILNEDLDKAIGKLAIPQKNLLDNISANIKSIQEGIDGDLDTVGDLMDQAEQILSSSILFGNKQPGVSRFKSRTILKGKCTDEQIRVIFKGKRLKHKDNILTINGKRFKPSDNIERSIEFLIPRSEFTTNVSANEYKKLKLHTHYYYGWWIFKWIKQKNYDFLSHIIVDDFATVAIQYETTTSRADTKPGKYNPPNIRLSTSLTSGARRRIIPHTITPQRPGYKIIPSSVRVHTQNESNRCRNARTRADVRQITQTVIRIDQYVETESGPFVSCNHDILVTWLETKNIESVKLAEVDLGTASFCDPIVHRLPHDFKNFLNATATLKSGKQIVFTGPEIQERFIQFKLDEHRKQIVLSGLFEKV